MTDLKTEYTSGGEFDLAFDGVDLETEGGVEGAVLRSLFLDARAREDDGCAGGPMNRRGWWGDAHGVAGDRMGSRLWLLKRANASEQTAALIEEYARESLKWLVEDGIAKAVTVIAERAGRHQINWQVEVVKPTGEGFRFEYVWEGI